MVTDLGPAAAAAMLDEDEDDDEAAALVFGAAAFGAALAMALGAFALEGFFSSTSNALTTISTTGAGLAAAFPFFATGLASSLGAASFLLGGIGMDGMDGMGDWEDGEDDWEANRSPRLGRGVLFRLLSRGRRKQTSPMCMGPAAIGTMGLCLATHNSLS
jgi:hypothetical protein